MEAAAARHERAISDEVTWVMRWLMIEIALDALCMHGGMIVECMQCGLQREIKKVRGRSSSQLHATFCIDIWSFTLTPSPLPVFSGLLVILLLVRQIFLDHSSYLAIGIEMLAYGPALVKRSTDFLCSASESSLR